MPAHWTVKRLKHLGEAIIGLTYGPEDVVDEGEGTLVLRSSNVQERQLALGDNVFVSKSIPEKLRTRCGDILICSRNGSRALIGKNAMIDAESAGSTFGAFMTVFRSKSNSFLLQVFNSPVFDYQSGTFLTSTINQLTVGNLRSFEVPTPPLSEQAQIARFLDYETGRIDALIEKQQQLIALLKEKRQAVISHAVTKGLNPNAPLRNSGVEWLGMVPVHWTLSQLKRTWRASDYGISESSNAEGIYEVLTMGDIREGELSTPGMRFVSCVDEHLLLVPGDLLFNRTNSLALVGKVGLFRAGTRVTFASYCVRLRVGAEHDPEFFNYLLNSDYVLTSARATSFPSIGQTNLNPTRYGGLPVAYPSLEEQKAISKHLNAAVAKLSIATKRAQEAVELLQERRSALICAAITGKIDVRNWTSPDSKPERDVA